MIKIQNRTGDSLAFLEKVEQIILDRVLLWTPDELYITCIDNWFDSKWLGFSGTIMHEISIRQLVEVTLPPFNPNRVVGSDLYLNEGKHYIRNEIKRPLHIYQNSTSNLKRKITDFSKNGLFIWYSGNSEPNGTGSIMGYLVQADNIFTFYLTLSSALDWGVKKAVGLTAEEANSILRITTNNVKKAQPAIHLKISC
ncbi:hypothetical protein [Rufibacter sp. LB8]|uniref:hypothetical protein n=1 Tax=Rufibacter sp. LB8 TaxID=2777781 RepID=UPI00178C81D7|nr:hypothetical protein [Rufibacter sp. LB8]